MTDYEVIVVAKGNVPEPLREPLAALEDDGALVSQAVYRTLHDEWVLVEGVGQDNEVLRGLMNSYPAHEREGNTAHVYTMNDEAVGRFVERMRLSQHVDAPNVTIKVVPKGETEPVFVKTGAQRHGPQGDLVSRMRAQHVGVE